MSEIQSIIFEKDMFTTKKANRWLKKNKISPIKKVHETKNYYRYRITEPDFDYYITKQLSDGIKLVIGAFNQ